MINMENIEEILEQFDKIEDYNMGAGYTVEDCNIAMQEYADQQTKALTDEINKLQSRISELQKSHNELLKIAKHYIKNHDYIVIANAEKLTNLKQTNKR